MKPRSTNNPIESVLFIYISIIILVCFNTAQVGQTDSIQEKKAVAGWLRCNSVPMGKPILCFFIKSVTPTEFVFALMKFELPY